MLRSDSLSADGLPRVVVLGAGFGGLQAAQALRRAPVRMTVIDRSNHHLFQPLLYQVATAGLSPADIASPVRHILRGADNTEVLMAEVTGIDTARREVLLTDGSVPYDYLIVATGARHSYFGHDEWAKFAPGLKSIQDATGIRDQVLRSFEMAEREEDEAKRREWLTFVLVGAGPTGAEMAGAIAELAHTALHDEFHHIDPHSARIVLVEAGARILSSFPESLSASARRKLEEMGVQVLTGHAVEEIDAEGVTAGGERIAARTVIWTAGVMASAAGAWLGAETDRAGRVLVDPWLRVPGRENVWVVGDTAHVEQNGSPLPGVAPVAMQQGRYVADAIKRTVSGKPSAPAFHYLDKGNLATVGRKFAVLAAGKVKLAGFIAWAAWLVIHIFYLIGFRNRLLVMLQWAWAYFTFDRGARIIARPGGGQQGKPPVEHAEPGGELLRR